MAYLSFFGCYINQHEPDRRTVAWDGLVYNGTCKHCDRLITRHGRRNWRVREEDATIRNAPKSNRG